ncbi:AbrB/MazE/SpoVT family DNA-binding domain-containing protein [Bacillus mycoides]|uniref:AbrB/MazE/SpoVT family DNA-binding domain-containing protein n=1 Tax=Bacillus mycoides TaxID=1405 RepID=UPI0007ABC064|nr:AbrB/MazE/SpoVT family DNA-binding domain-containing protein [Bacillus mycoides]KZE03972.1 Transcriptional regulator AbrB [Bacillus mycoides]MBE7147551.1 AbrB/MazE/SpoVT family DNA-binding domain-containing protein [Bacillus mycoides]
MKATGITRKVDALGRIVLPKELRDVLGIDINKKMEIYVKEDAIILKKYEPYGTCIVTGEVSKRNVSLVNGKFNLSPEGAKQLAKELEQLFAEK